MRSQYVNRAFCICGAWKFEVNTLDVVYGPFSLRRPACLFVELRPVLFAPWGMRFIAQPLRTTLCRSGPDQLHRLTSMSPEAHQSCPRRFFF
jgi:hypothetical protein